MTQLEEEKEFLKDIEYVLDRCDIGINSPIGDLYYWAEQLKQLVKKIRNDAFEAGTLYESLMSKESPTDEDLAGIHDLSSYKSLKQYLTNKQHGKSEE